MPEGVSVPLDHQIKAAKEAQEALALQSKEEAPPGSPPFQPPSELQSLTDRVDPQLIDPAFQKPEETHEEPTQSLDDISWHMMDDRPAESPQKLDRSKIDSKSGSFENEDRRKLREEESEKLIIENPYLRSYTREVLNTLRWSYDKQPEEVSILVQLLKLHDTGGPSSGHDNTPKAVGLAFQVLKARISGGIRLETSAARFESSGINDYIRFDDVSVDLLANLKSNLREITQADFDATVLTALSCGDPYTALNLIQKADQFLPKQGADAVANATSRLLGPQSKVFDKAYELATRSVKDRIDGVIASIGEGPFEKLGTLTIAKDRKSKAEKSLRDHLRNKRDKWYDSQAISREDTRREQLDNPHLKKAISEGASKNQHWDSIKRSLMEKAKKVADAKAANKLSAELHRRLMPQMNLEAQMDDSKSVAIRTNNRDRRRQEYSTWNNNESAYGYEVIRDDSAAAKKDSVNALYYQSETEITDELFDPNKIGLKTLVAFMKNPDAFAGRIDGAIENYKRGKRNDYDLEQNTQALNRGKIELGKKVVAGLSFLQTLVENPDALALLKQEFGFGDYINPDNLEKALARMQIMFRGTAQDETDHTLFDSFLVEGQTDEDKNTIDRLMRSKKAEEAKILQGKKEDLKVVLAEAMLTTQDEIPQLKDKLDKRKAAQQRIDDLMVQRAELEEKKRGVEAMKVVKIKLPFIGTNSITQDEKTLTLTSIEAQLTKLNTAMIPEAQGLEAAYNTVDDSKIQEAESTFSYYGQLAQEMETQ